MVIERNKMAKGIIAFEEEALPTAPTEENQIDAEAAANEAQTAVDNAGIAEDKDRISEAVGVQDAVSKIATQVDNSITAGTGISDQTAAILEVSVEHFCKRLGYSKQVVPSMEGFKDAVGRLEQSRIALENLQELNAKLTKNISIAQEGFFARIGNAFVRLFTTTNKMLRTLEASRNLVASEEHLIKDPAWGRIFFSTKKFSLTGEDVISLMEDINDLNHNRIIPLTKRITELFSEAIAQVNRSTYIANDDAVRKINLMINDSYALRKEVEEMVTVEVVEESIDVLSASTDQIHRLCDIATRSIHDNQKSYQFYELLDKVDDSYYQIEKNRESRLLTIFTKHEKNPNGSDAADIVAYHRMLEAGAIAAVDLLRALNEAEYKIAYGAYKYIKASIQKD